MHVNGVCHRDIKPDNILYDPIRRKIKIIDFDIARIKKFMNSRHEMMTKTGCISYRAPEIFNAVYD
jgi:serine/threonine protein kinase